jgi:hypothetical protein
MVPKCHYCDHEGHTDDHILPKSIGGPNAKWNYVPACIDCNEAKGNQTYEQFTGKDELPKSCQDRGFPTTASFLLFAKQLRAVYGTDIRRTQSKPKLPGHLRPKPVEQHPGFVHPCIHEGPCKGQDGCRIRRRSETPSGEYNGPLAGS